MTDEELAEIEKEIASWIFSRRIVGERLIAEVRRLKRENRALQLRLDLAEGRRVV